MWDSWHKVNPWWRPDVCAMRYAGVNKTNGTAREHQIEVVLDVDASDKTCSAAIEELSRCELDELRAGIHDFRGGT